MNQSITKLLATSIRLLIIGMPLLGNTRSAQAGSTQPTHAIKEMLNKQAEKRLKLGFPEELFTYKQSNSTSTQLFTCQPTEYFLNAAHEALRPLLIAIIPHEQTGRPCYFEAHALNEHFFGYPLITPDTSLNEMPSAALPVFKTDTLIQLTDIKYYAINPQTQKKLIYLCTAAELMSRTDRGHKLRNLFYDNWLDPFYLGYAYFWGQGRYPQNFGYAEQLFESVFATSSNKTIREEAQWYLKYITALGLRDQATIKTAQDAQRFLKELADLRTDANSSLEVQKQLLMGKVYAKLDDKKHAIEAFENVIQLGCDSTAVAIAHQSLCYLADTIEEQQAHLKAARMQQSSLLQAMAAQHFFITAPDAAENQALQTAEENIINFYRNGIHNRNPVLAGAQVLQKIFSVYANAQRENPGIQAQEILTHMRQQPLLNRSPYPYNTDATAFLFITGINYCYLQEYEKSRYFLEKFLASDFRLRAPTAEELFTAHAYLGLIYRQGYGIFPNAKRAEEHFTQAIAAKYAKQLPREQDKLKQQIFNNWVDGTLESLNNSDNLKGSLELMQQRVNSWGQSCKNFGRKIMHYTVGTRRRRMITYSLLATAGVVTVTSLLARKTNFFNYLFRRNRIQPLGVHV